METQTLEQDENLMIGNIGGGGGGGTGQVVAFQQGVVMEDAASKEVAIIKHDVSDNEGASGGGEIGGGNGSSSGGGGGSSLSTFTSVLKSVRGLRKYGPSFLTKTFEMVDSLETNSIISWSSSGTSFIIWDSNKFCIDLLPKYFRHNNFSSFIYQLNNYGFKKINWDRWEYAHQEFQAGKKHLLKNIKRRNQQSQATNQQVAKKPCPDLGKFVSESQLEKLRNDQNKMKVTIQKLEQKQEKMDNHLATFKKHLQNSICRQQKLVSFIANSLIPTFVQQLRQKRKQDNDEAEIEKRPKMVEQQSTEMSLMVEPQVQPELTTVQPEIPTLSSVHDSGPVQGQRANVASGTNLPDLNSDKYTMLEKLMEDDLMCESEPEGELANKQSKIVIELEDLIGKPPDWGCYMKELMKGVDCQESKP